ncbi:MAG: DUF5615 family PIN-like protein [Deltaproteobacteria bacterium]|nr:DUF5615 family PIN-like protein [Deltaproteobacteria bacterium]
MRVLLDECVPRPLKHQIPEHEVSTVQELGWAGKRNGELLALITSADFDVFVTTDQNIENQQNLGKAGVPLIVLIAKSNKLRALLPLVPKLKAAVGRVARGEVLHVEA